MHNIQVRMKIALAVNKGKILISGNGKAISLNCTTVKRGTQILLPGCATDEVMIIK